MYWDCKELFKKPRAIQAIASSNTGERHEIYVDALEDITYGQ
jgi:hypothetical protein